MNSFVSDVGSVIPRPPSRAGSSSNCRTSPGMQRLVMARNQGCSDCRLQWFQSLNNEMATSEGICPFAKKAMDQ